MSDDRGKKFIKGAAILAGAGIMIKVLGAVFRIPLTNWIGATGMAYYGMAYTIYGVLVVIGTAGVPVAVSRLVAESIAVNNYRNAHKVFRVALELMGLIGLVGFLICFFGGDMIAAAWKYPEGGLVIKCMAPALFFVPFFSAFRGFFNGRQNMTPTAVSEITEQLVRCGVGLALAYTFYKAGNELYAAAGASFGASAGAIGGLLVILVIFLASRRMFAEKIAQGSQEEEEAGAVLKKILVIAIPIIIGCEIMPIMTVIDTSIITRVLENTGWSHDEARYMYGLFSGFCNALIAFPQIFTQAVAVSLVPAISGYYKLNNTEKVQDTVRLGYRITMIMAFPCAFGIFVLAEPILRLLYFHQAQGCHDAMPTLMVMAISIIFLAHMQTSTSVLQSVGKQMIPVRNLAIGCVGKVIVTYVLVGIHVVNIKGAAFGTMFAYVVAMILNDYCVKKYTGTTHNISLAYVRPAAAAGIMALCAMGIYYGLKTAFAGSVPLVDMSSGINAICVVIAILLAMGIYAVLLFAIRCLTVDELSEFPMGDKLEKIARKLGAK